MPQYSLEYDAEMCEWVARSDGESYSAECPQQAQQWLAKALMKDETPEERAALERAREVASKGT